MEKELVCAALSSAFGSYLRDIEPFTSETVLSPDDVPMYSGLFIPECYFYPVLWSFMYDDFNNSSKYIGSIVKKVGINDDNKDAIINKLSDIVYDCFSKIRSHEDMMFTKVLAGVYMSYIVDKFGERERIRIGRDDIVPEIRNTVYGYHNIMPTREFLEKCTYDFPTINPLLIVNLMDRFGLWYESDSLSYSIDCFSVPKYKQNNDILPFETFCLPVFNCDFVNGIMVEHGYPMITAMPIGVHDEDVEDEDDGNVIMYMPSIMPCSDSKDGVHGFSMMRHPLRTFSMGYEFAFRCGFDKNHVMEINRVKNEVIMKKNRGGMTAFRSSDDLLN